MSWARFSRRARGPSRAADYLVTKSELDMGLNPDGGSPLSGVRVLDASRVLAGPFCGQILGDLGADVVKIERPGSGDETRAWGPPFVGALSAYYLSCNRNKKSVTLDIGGAAGKDVFHRLAKA